MQRLFLRRIVGHSMLPTLHENQIIIAIKKPFQIGDVVIAWVGGKEVIKRVTFFDEGDGRVLLHGDNTNDSTDSRDYGSVTSELISGVVVWPRHLTTAQA